MDAPKPQVREQYWSGDKLVKKIPVGNKSVFVETDLKTGKTVTTTWVRSH
jgi:hypothetical protein